jgi:hypothetical protein
MTDGAQWSASDRCQVEAVRQPTDPPVTGRLLIINEFKEKCGGDSDTI